nr:hypothetical protein [Tanacetum cinerariifolium]
MLLIFIVLRSFDDAEIIESITPSATPTKDTKATSLAILSVTLLDLESQTDKNTTPVNTVKSIATSSGDNETKHKCPAEDDIEVSLQMSKKMVEVKIEKDA